MRVVKGIIASFMLLSITLTPVYANSLDNVVGGTRDEAVQEEVQDTEGTRGSSGSDFVDGIEQAGNLTANLGDANKVTGPLRTGVGFVVGILATAIPLLLVLRVMIDLLYIFIPFSRKLLSGGAQAQQSGGMGGGMGGGFGGGGFGGGGFGGGRMGMSGGDQQSGGIQWVSNQALNAVAGESGQQSSGGGMGGFGGGFGGGMSQQPQSGKSAFKVYSKDMVITLTIAPVMLVLALSGVLTSLGTALGEAAVGAIQNLIGMI